MYVHSKYTSVPFKFRYFNYILIKQIGRKYFELLDWKQPGIGFKHNLFVAFKFKKKNKNDLQKAIDILLEYCSYIWFANNK